ncbi:MAG: hypothetical protein IJO61_09090 [Oscillospiraceae bacterium]|nr:hypothetical protein [Oscillospiraceae bacterium]
MKQMICVMVCVFLMTFPCFASEDSLTEVAEMDEISDSVPKDTGDIEYSEDISFTEGLSKIYEKIKEEVGDIFTGGLRCVMMIVAVSFLTSSVGAITLTGESGAAKTTASLVGAIAVTAVASGSIKSVIGMGEKLIESVSVFSKALLPTLAAVEAASGMPGSAMAKVTAAALFSDILITMIDKILMPLVYVNIFAATANAASENAALKRLSDLSVKVISATLKIILGAFVSYITVTGIVAASADRAGVKTAKFAISGAVPVVGGIISDATATVISGTAVLKNSVGVFGMLVIISSSVTPVITLAINYSLFRFASVCASPVIGTGISDLSERLASSFVVVLAMVASCITVLLLTIVMIMQSTGVT